MNKLCVVVINYKTPYMTIRCADSLLSGLAGILSKIIIVDNNSGDESIEVMSSWIKRNGVNDVVNIISSSINGGFSYGCNLGASSCDSEYLLFINSDALVEKNSIKIMLSIIERGRRIGILAPEVHSQYGEIEKSRFYNKTPLNEFLKAAGTGVITKVFNTLGVHEVAQYIDDINTPPEWVSFVCVLLSRKMYAQVGDLDEGYFMYSEDNDYCRRMVTNGWKLAITNKAKVVHFNKGLSNAKGKRLPAFYYASRARYFRKHYGCLGLLVANCLFMLGMFIRYLRYLIGKGIPYKHKLSVFDIWRNFLYPLRCREIKRD